MTAPKAPESQTGSSAEAAATADGRVAALSVAASLLTTASTGCFALALYICAFAPTTGLLLGLLGMMLLSAAHFPEDAEGMGESRVDEYARRIRSGALVVGSGVDSLLRSVWPRAS